jgi:hypothetical protein
MISPAPFPHTDITDTSYYSVSLTTRAGLHSMDKRGHNVKWEHDKAYEFYYDFSETCFPLEFSG